MGTEGSLVFFCWLVSKGKTLPKKKQSSSIKLTKRQGIVMLIQNQKGCLGFGFPFGFPFKPRRVASQRTPPQGSTTFGPCKASLRLKHRTNAGSTSRSNTCSSAHLSQTQCLNSFSPLDKNKNLFPVVFTYTPTGGSSCTY